MCSISPLGLLSLLLLPMIAFASLEPRKACIDALLNYKSRTELEVIWEKRNQSILEDLARRLAFSDRIVFSAAIIGGPRSGKTTLSAEIKDYLRGGHADRYVAWSTDQPEEFGPITFIRRQLIDRGALPPPRSVQKFADNLDTVELWEALKLPEHNQLLGRLSKWEEFEVSELILLEATDKKYISEMVLRRIDVIYDLHNWVD